MARWRFWRRPPRVQPIASAADAARDRGDWAAAGEHYARVVELQPGNAAMWVQYGHALKETGSLAAAERAYARAAALTPNDPDTHLQLGHALKLLGRRQEAVDAFAAAVSADPRSFFAHDELVRLGERDRVSDGASVVRRDAAAREVDDLARRTVDAVGEAARLAALPPRSYEAFCRAFPVTAPPRFDPPSTGLTVVVDAQAAIPAMLRSTLASLVDQSFAGWRARVLAPAAMAAHPVGSFAHVEPRVRFVEDAAEALTDGPALVLAAGTILDPQALAWLSFAAARTGANVIHADHDHGRERWHDAVERWSPAFYWAHDPQYLADAPVPAMLLADAGALAAVDAPALLAAHGAEGVRRAVLLAAGGGTRVVHVPRLLATVLALPAEAEASRPDPLPAALPAWRPPAAAPAVDGTIHAIVPTRDEPEMLERCVATLRACAARPDRLRLTIVDNRSEREETRRLLAAGAADGRFEVLAFDEPFNWSRANNLAAAGSDAAILLFLNNDTEMLTRGWDTRLRARLAERDVGTVGARLLYPDGAVQHGGVLLGCENGLPVHEAWGAAGDAAGPMARFVTPHRTAAVTGAFLAVPRALFERVGGFDERNLFIANNDVDFCLKVREAGQAVVYDPTIEAIHHESRTRGFSVTRTQVAWEHAERETLHRRWGDALFEDPSYNPHWPLRGAPFDGLREPTTTQILDHIDRTARPLPWAAARSNA